MEVDGGSSHFGEAKFSLRVKVGCFVDLLMLHLRFLECRGSGVFLKYGHRENPPSTLATIPALNTLLSSEVLDFIINDLFILGARGESKPWDLQLSLLFMLTKFLVRNVSFDIVLSSDDF